MVVFVDFLLLLRGDTFKRMPVRDCCKSLPALAVA
jgi:hypothetical protein